MPITQNVTLGVGVLSDIRTQPVKYEIARYPKDTPTDIELGEI